MEEGNSIIYGLEHQTRALSPQYGESDAIRFLIGTQSLKPNSNQIHVVELEEDTGALHTKVIPKDLDDLSAIQSRNAEDMELLLTIKPEVRNKEIAEKSGLYI
ncbi:hypothetical protein HF086_003271 [Spodoptera exigua]|uniref:Uncharacterized protein n=1 Tax=Spodoptera exigua TaxID=7107 RepID=A0A922SGK7_SPOEX|nr:hypothetical protein HF086_003271 [Spodoptera exigua]